MLYFSGEESVEREGVTATEILPTLHIQHLNFLVQNTHFFTVRIILRSNVNYDSARLCEIIDVFNGVKCVTFGR